MVAGGEDPGGVGGDLRSVVNENHERGVAAQIAALEERRGFDLDREDY